MSEYKTIIAEIIEEFKNEGKKITSVKIKAELLNKRNIKLSGPEVKKIIEEIESENENKSEEETENEEPENVEEEKPKQSFIREIKPDNSSIFEDYKEYIKKVQNDTKVEEIIEKLKDIEIHNDKVDEDYTKMLKDDLFRDNLECITKLSRDLNEKRNELYRLANIDVNNKEYSIKFETKVKDKKYIMYLIKDNKRIKQINIDYSRFNSDIELIRNNRYGHKQQGETTYINYNDYDLIDRIINSGYFNLISILDRYKLNNNDILTLLKDNLDYRNVFDNRKIISEINMEKQELELNKYDKSITPKKSKTGIEVVNMNLATITNTISSELIKMIKRLEDKKIKYEVNEIFNIIPTLMYVNRNPDSDKDLRMITLKRIFDLINNEKRFDDLPDEYSKMAKRFKALISSPFYIAKMLGFVESEFSNHAKSIIEYIHNNKDFLKMIEKHFHEISYLYLPTHLYHDRMNSEGVIDMGYCTIGNVYEFWVHDIYTKKPVNHSDKTNVIMKKILG